MKKFDDSPSSPGGRRLAVYILLFAVVFKLAFILYSGDLVYYDVNTALSHGRTYFEKSEPGTPLAILPGVKTYLGPIAWYQVYSHLGVYGLKAFNLAAFVLLFALQYAIGRKYFPPRVTAAALFIFAFYSWTNLNVAAGEQDDMMSALFLTLGVVLYVYGYGAFLAALVMSAGVLFKYTAGIYAIGFIIYLIYTRDMRQVLMALGGLILPFLCLNVLTGFSSLEALLSSSNLKRQLFNTPVKRVIFKFFSTGMFLFLPLAVWAVWRNRSRPNILLFSLSSVYIVFVVLARNAYSSGFHMMQSVLFSSFLIAQVFLTDPFPGGVKARRLFGASAVALYILITTAVTLNNLESDTRPIDPHQVRYKKLHYNPFLGPGRSFRHHPMP